MSQEHLDSVNDRLNVRSYCETDHSIVAELYTGGLLAGQIAPSDTGADIENIQDAYFADPASHLWVAELDGKVVGMIGVVRQPDHTAEIRRLRVNKRWQQTSIGGQLMETALAHCKHHGYLKVVLDTRFDPAAVVDLFDRFGFQHTRTKTVEGKEQLDFYLDIYRHPSEDEG